MARPLPFVVQPKAVVKERVGSEDYGVLEIRRINDLSVNERKYIRQQTEHLKDPNKEAVRISQAIADESGLPLVEVYEALVSGNTEFLEEHLEAMIKFQDLINEVTVTRQIVMATAILRFRVDPEWTVEDTGNDNLIHPELLKAVIEFAQKEESNWKEPAKPEEEAKPELTEEVLGESLIA